VRVSTDTAELFFALLTLAAGFGAIALLGLRAAAALGSDSAARVGRSVGEASVWLAFLVAAVSTVGSLYFSESAGYVPCRLCWFQRIAMYPLTVILLVGAVRRDPAVRWYAGPIALVGAGVAGYHVMLERWPSLDTGACDASGPSCTFVWFEEFGFVTLATMALVGFLTILTLLFVRFPDTLDERDAAPPEASDHVEMESV
jgi:disulfide bond formation protein DsbB